jgi:endo-1,4-beta-xylanase
MSRRTSLVGACLTALLSSACSGDAREVHPGFGNTPVPTAGAGGSAASEPLPVLPRPPQVDPTLVPEGMTLRAAAEASGHLIGIALQARRLREEPEYAATAAAEFNYVTAENEMKWSNLQREPGTFDFGPADEIVAFAEQNGMAVKGHTLVWHSQLPQWVSALTTPEEVRAAMLTHISTVVSHYRGRLSSWDVVNEAWQDNGSALRDSVFRVQLGEGFIDEAFHAARAADPDAKLYYNDYGAEGNSRKASSIYAMVQGMLQRGVPIDGVGMQMHTRSVGNVTPSITEFSANMQRLRELGLEVVVSELDVATCSDQAMDDRMTQQGSRYYDIVRACVSEPACSAVTIWGVIDRYSWLNNQGQQQSTGCATGQQPLALLFDDTYAKKPAYAGVLSALRGM